MPKGDEAAFRELVDAYGPVFGLISRSVSQRTSRGPAEVFWIYRGRRIFVASRAHHVIYRIVINLLSQRRPQLATISLDQRDDDDRPALDPGGPDRAFGDMVLRDRLDKAILQLPVPYQVLINGHYMKDMRYEDLAEALGMPMGTVKTHLHRAKKQLRRILEAERS